MRTDKRTVKYRCTLWKGRPIHAFSLPFVTIRRPVKTRAAGNDGSQHNAEKNNGGCGGPSEDPRREKRLQYPEFGRCRGHGSFRGRRQREDTKWVLATQQYLRSFFLPPFSITFHVPFQRKACWRDSLINRGISRAYIQSYMYVCMYVCSHSRIRYIELYDIRVNTTHWKGISNWSIKDIRLTPPIRSKRLPRPVSEIPGRRHRSLGGHFSSQRSERDRDDRWDERF